MATNPYIKVNTYLPQQDLIEDLIEEAIKFYGNDVKYMPRTVVLEDPLFGEDALSKFENAIDLEMYVRNVEGFDGQGDIFSKFGLDVKDQLVLTVSRRRFEQITTENFLDEQGFTLRLESANTINPTSSDYMKLEGNTYSLSSTRPLEGDLVYFPLVNKVFEITFVEHEDLFYQYGRLQTYDLRCEVFDYSSERFETGNTALDLIANTHSFDIRESQLVMEDGDLLLFEDGGTLILEDQRIEDKTAIANNEFYEKEAESIIDFSESNPFSQFDRW